MACTSLAAHYLPCLTYLNAGSTALAPHGYASINLPSGSTATTPGIYAQPLSCLAPHGLVLAAHSLVPFYPGRSQPHRTRPPQGSRTFSGRRQGTLLHCYYTLLLVTISYCTLLPNASVLVYFIVSLVHCYCVSLLLYVTTYCLTVSVC